MIRRIDSTAHDDALATPGVSRSAFGEQLRRARVRAGLSQEALAERAHLSTSAIAALERGRRTLPRPTTVSLLADGLGLSPEERAVLAAAAHERGQPSSEPGSDVPAERRLPLPPTTLFGRECDVARVIELLRSPGEQRLVSLLGPGGVGKTRLAIAVAAALEREYRDGVLFVDLSAVREHRLVTATVARAFGLRETGGQSARDLLIAHLHGHDLLLVLDNFEQLLGAAPSLAELLTACPGLSVLVTSRAALRLRSERRYAVPALATPTGDEAASAELIASAPAVRLFVDRAQAVTPDFTLDDANAAAVGAICRRLDGLPLAIELAAANAAVLSPAGLLRRLDALAPLMVGASDLPPRQQSLHATIEWSYGLLSPTQQALLRWLGVFRGGCPLEAIEVVAASLGSHGDLVSDLRALVDHSLVVTRRHLSDAPRFGLLETIREYAQLQLAAAGELERASQAHADYYLGLAQTAEAHLNAADQLEWLGILEEEHDNLQEALAHARRTQNAEAGLQLGGALWRFWYLHCHMTTGRYWLHEVLALPGAPSVSMLNGRTRVLAGLAAIYCTLTEYDRVAEIAEEGVRLARELDDQVDLAFFINVQAIVARNQNDLPRAAALGDECVALARAVGNDWALALALHNLADVMRIEAVFDRAEALARESLAVATRMNDRWGMLQAELVLGWIACDQGDFEAAAERFAACRAAATALCHARDTARALAGLGEVALARGQVDAADELLEEAAAGWRRLGDAIRLAQVLVVRGRLACTRGKSEQAVEQLAEALRLYRSRNHVLGTAECLEGLAGVLSEKLEHAEQVVRLIGQATLLREQIGAPAAPTEEARYAPGLGNARARLGEQAFARHWQAGRAMAPQALLEAIGLAV